MDGGDRRPGAEHSGAGTGDIREEPASTPPPTDVDAAVGNETMPADADDDSLFDDVSHLIDGGVTYAKAELAFQKTRAGFAGRLIGVSAGLVIVAIILLHIAFLALAVGLVIAFEPLVTIWGAIAIVFGGLLALVGLLGWMAFKRVKKVADLFAEPQDSESGGESA